MSQHQAPSHSPAPALSPLPWHVDRFRRDICIRDANDNVVIRDKNAVDGIPEKYAFIVRAVNSHTALVESAKALVALIGACADGDEITLTPENIQAARRAALALADEQPQSKAVTP